MHGFPYPDRQMAAMTLKIQPRQPPLPHGLLFPHVRTLAEAHERPAMVHEIVSFDTVSLRMVRVMFITNRRTQWRAGRYAL